MSRFSLPSQRPAVHSVTPHEAPRGTAGLYGELIAFITPGRLRIVSPALHERDAAANTALATALTEELEYLRQGALRLGAGQ